MVTCFKHVRIDKSHALSIPVSWLPESLSRRAPSRMASRSARVFSARGSSKGMLIRSSTVSCGLGGTFKHVALHVKHLAGIDCLRMARCLDAAEHLLRSHGNCSRPGKVVSLSVFGR